MVFNEGDIRFIAVIAICAAGSFGKRYTPVEMHGNAMLSQPYTSANRMEFV